MQFIPMLASVEEGIVESFREGGGVPYGSYRRFQRLMAEDTAALHDVTLIDAIIPLIGGLPQRLEEGIDVLDIGCGSGHAINLLARAFPASRFTGYDISDEGIAAARREAAEWGLNNAAFEVRDVTVLAMAGRFDLITAFDAIHDQAHPAQVLAGVARALRPRGTFLMVDIRASSNLEENLGLPLAPTLYTISTMHCMTVSLALGGVGLGTVWGEQLARKMLAEAGFTSVAVKAVEGDIFNNYFIARKD
jgi:SAM-dependent methyltransferase